MGLSLNMGLQGQGAFGSGFGGASLPEAAQQPTGPTTIGARAFGITSGESRYPYAHIGFLSVGVAALAGLIWIYWSLPR